MLLRGGSSSGHCLAAGSPDAAGGIKITYQVESSLNPLIFAQSLSNILLQKQNVKASLTQYTTSSGAIYSVWLNSTASLRDSPTLKGGWREVYDFDVYFGRKGSSDTALQVDGILRPMVARQAIGNLASYHGLDDAQRSAYLSVFDDLVEIL
jgi:hypothetical protein